MAQNSYHEQLLRLLQKSLMFAQISHSTKPGSCKLACDQQEPDNKELIIIMTSCDRTQQEPDNDRLIIMMTSCDSAQQEPDEGGEEGKRPKASQGQSYAGMWNLGKAPKLCYLSWDAMHVFGKNSLNVNACIWMSFRHFAIWLFRRQPLCSPPTHQIGGGFKRCWRRHRCVWNS